MEQNSLPVNALIKLVEGNKRFTNGLRSVEALASVNKRKELTEKGQKPFAIILSCSDSRVPAEILFDQGLGDLFIVRVAGNVIAPSLLASIEFAATTFQTPLCVVMGHTHCGAVKAAMAYVKGDAVPGSKNLQDLIERIAPAAKKGMSRGQDSGNSVELDCIRENAAHTKTRILEESPIVSGLVSQGKLALVTAVYDLETGKVNFES